MDGAKYLELRDTVRRRHAQVEKDQDFLIDFAKGVARLVNVISGSKRRICAAGSMLGTKFIDGEFDASGSSIGFTLQIEFHDDDEVCLFAPLIHFTAVAREDSFSVTCKSTRDWVDQAREAATTEEGQLAVVRLLDKALTEEVNSTLSYTLIE